MFLRRLFYVLGLIPYIGNEKYRKIVISTRGTIVFEDLFWTGTIQGRVQIKGGYYCQIPEMLSEMYQNYVKMSTFCSILVDFH